MGREVRTFARVRLEIEMPVLRELTDSPERRAAYDHRKRTLVDNLKAQGFLVRIVSEEVPR